MKSRSIRLALLLCSLLWGANGSLADDASSDKTKPSEKAKPSRGTLGRNVLLICVDDLRPELGCYGVDYISSPNIDALAKRGALFNRHYVQAPTCGASRYALLTGRYGPTSNGALFARANWVTSPKLTVPPSMPKWYRDQGYTTVSVGKVSHHPGGRGGSDWNSDDKPEMPGAWSRHLMPVGDWQHPRGAMHGLANGEIRGNAKQMAVYQSTEGEDTIYPDGLITDEAIRQIKTLTSDEEKPFFLAVGIIRPHLPFGAPKKYMEPYRNAELPPIPHPNKPEGKTTWHGSGEFMKYNRWGRNPNTDPEFATEVRRHYAACVTYADAQVGRILQALDESGKRDETIIVLWGDHGWHLGEHAVWGKHTLFEESLRSPLILQYKGIKHESVKEAVRVNAIVETVDIFPTLAGLTHAHPGFGMHGQSLFGHLIGWHPDVENNTQYAIAYHRGATTLRTPTHRLIVHKSGQTELYNHTSPAGETKNIAEEEPKLVEKLKMILETRLQKFPQDPTGFTK